jgi:hypothetical protein
VQAAFDLRRPARPGILPACDSAGSLGAHTNDQGTAPGAAGRSGRHRAGRAGPVEGGRRHAAVGLGHEHDADDDDDDPEQVILSPNSSRYTVRVVPFNP